MHIGLNAHLLASQAGYRSAGIHGYIYNTLAHLAAVAPADWQFTAMVGARSTHHLPGIHLRHAHLDTESPLRRILWEQALQPAQLGAFDLVHALAFVSPLLLTKPSIVTVYDLSFVHYPQVLSTARRLYLRLFTRISCRRARRIIAISRSTAQDVATHLHIPADRIDVAVPGYDHTVYRPLPTAEVAAFRQQHHLPERFWLFLGTLEPRKNLVTLLTAYAALPPSQRLPLVLAGGKGWDYDPIFAAIDRYNLVRDVLLPGYLPLEDLPYWYNSAEVFLYPSVFEGFGLPVLEAMGCGTPVIVSDTSSLPEAAGTAGRLVPPLDVNAWTTALRQAYQDAEWRRQAAERGLQEVQSFTWGQTAEATIASYQQAMTAS
jgi:glycosyltransferase involved in cell wall biosynthesis